MMLSRTQLTPWIEGTYFISHAVSDNSGMTLIDSTMQRELVKIFSGSRGVQIGRIAIYSSGGSAQNFGDRKPITSGRMPA